MANQPVDLTSNELKDLKLVTAEELKNFLISKKAPDYILTCMAMIRGDELDAALKQEGHYDLTELLPNLPSMSFKSFVRTFEDMRDNNDNVLIERELLVRPKLLVSELKSGTEVPLAAVPPSVKRPFASLEDNEFYAVLIAWKVDKESAKKIVDLDLEGFCLKVSSIQEFGGNGKELSDYYDIPEALGDKIFRKISNCFPMIDSAFVKECLKSSSSSGLLKDYTPSKKSDEETEAEKARRLKSSSAQATRIQSFQNAQSNLKRKETGKGFGGRSAKKVSDPPQVSGFEIEEAPITTQIVLKNVSIYLQESLSRFNKSNCAKLMQSSGWFKLTSITINFITGTAEEFEQIIKQKIQDIFTEKLGEKKLLGAISVFYLTDRSTNPTPLCHLEDISMDAISAIATNTKIRWLFLYIDPNAKDDEESDDDDDDLF